MSFYYDIRPPLFKLPEQAPPLLRIVIHLWITFADTKDFLPFVYYGSASTMIGYGNCTMFMLLVMSKHFPL